MMKDYDAIKQYTMDRWVKINRTQLLDSAFFGKDEDVRWKLGIDLKYLN